MNLIDPVTNLSMYDTPENRLKVTFYVVEANSFEMRTLWRDHARDSNDRIGEPVKWNQLDGRLIQIGELDGHPLCLSLHWVMIDDKLIVFWDSCSRVTDFEKSESWIKKHFDKKWRDRNAMCDASNFRNCLQAIKDSNKIQ